MIKRVMFDGSIEYLLTAEEVMRILHISRSKLYLMVDSGELPTVHIGRLLRFRQRDVQALIEMRGPKARPKGTIRKGKV